MGLFDFLLGPPDVENLKTKKDAEGLLKALKYKKDNDVRVRAAVALADLFGPPDVENLKAMRDVEGLLKALKYEEKDNDVRENAAAAIRELRDEKSAEPLIHALKDEDEAVREKAAVALGEIGYIERKGIKQGGFGEPYCSDECYSKAGNEIANRILMGTSGACDFCQSSVYASVDNAGEFVTFPYRGRTCFICKSCFPKGKEYVKTINECCMCGKSL